MKKKLDAVRCAFAIGMAAFWFYGPALGAADSNEHFDPKIITWAEGVILSLDIDAGKFSIRGSKKPYATAYARMMQEINEKTKNLQSEKRQKTVEDIRVAWRDKLLFASKEPSSKDGDFSFSLPSKTASIYVLPEKKWYGKVFKETPADTRVTLDENESAAMKTLKDFKVGDAVVVGYESGIIYNTAYAIITIASAKETTWAPSPASAATGDVGAVPADADAARRIQKDIVGDRSLSPAAKNVSVLAKDGTVTLVGVVQTEEEKKVIEGKAAAVVGADKVKCNLEVKK